MVGDAQRRGVAGRLNLQFHQHFGNVLGDGADPRGLVRHRGIGVEHVAVILHRRAAAGSVDDDGVEALPVHLRHPGVDIGGGGGVAFAGLAHVMGQRAATAHALRDHHFAAEAGQQANGRLVDIRVQRPLRATGHQRDALLPWRGGGMGLRLLHPAWGGHGGRGEGDH